MRPVTRGPSNAYDAVNQYWVDLSKAPFNPQIQNIFNTNQPDWCLVNQFLLEFAKQLNLKLIAQPNTDNTPLAITVGPQTTTYACKTYNSIYNSIWNEMRSEINTQITGTYKKAGGPLTQNMGAYCSYCESPISGLLEVEHIAAKAPYPTISVAWDNFLLACSPCNNAKGDTPIVFQSQGIWNGLPMPKPANAPVIPNADYQYLDFIWGYYLFPNDQNAYNYLGYHLGYNTAANGWQPLPANSFFNVNNTIDHIDQVQKEVFIHFQNPNLPPNLPAGNVTQVRVEYLAASPPLNAADRIVDLCKLNRDDPGSGSVTYDRRVMNRTIAWFTILNLVGGLQGINTATPAGVAQYNMFWASIIMHAQSMGFYSVWVTILAQFPDQTGGHASLARRFVVDTTNPAEPYSYFPGTNAAGLP